MSKSPLFGAFDDDRSGAGAAGPGGNDVHAMGLVTRLDCPDERQGAIVRRQNLHSERLREARGCGGPQPRSGTDVAAIRPPRPIGTLKPRLAGGLDDGAVEPVATVTTRLTDLSIDSVGHSSVDWSERAKRRRDDGDDEEEKRRRSVKDRRRRYLVLNPAYFGPELELADPLLYDRLVRRFQSPAEREAEGRQKGFSGVLEADLRRSEAKLAAIANPNPRSTFSFSRGPDGEIVAEEDDDEDDEDGNGMARMDKDDALARWRYEMEMRFVRGEDDDFEYGTVDSDERYDDHEEVDRRREDVYFDGEEPRWEGGPDRRLTGETGVQDF